MSLHYLSGRQVLRRGGDFRHATHSLALVICWGSWERKVVCVGMFGETNNQGKYKENTKKTQRAVQLQTNTYTAGATALRVRGVPPHSSMLRVCACDCSRMRADRQATLSLCSRSSGSATLAGQHSVAAAGRWAWSLVPAAVAPSTLVELLVCCRETARWFLLVLEARTCLASVERTATQPAQAVPHVLGYSSLRVAVKPETREVLRGMVHNPSDRPLLVGQSIDLPRAVRSINTISTLGRSVGNSPPATPCSGDMIWLASLPAHVCVDWLRPS